jgi:hypothetical protein
VGQSLAGYKYTTIFPNVVVGGGQCLNLVCFGEGLEIGSGNRNDGAECGFSKIKCLTLSQRDINHVRLSASKIISKRIALVDFPN